MPKPKFTPVTVDNQLREPVEYTPLIYIAGTQTHRLALHKRINTVLPESRREWVVSHPASGAKVLEVTSVYKGVPCSSAGAPLKQARADAIACLDALLERVGSERFNAVLAGAVGPAKAA